MQDYRNKNRWLLKKKNTSTSSESNAIEKAEEMTFLELERADNLNALRDLVLAQHFTIAGMAVRLVGGSPSDIPPFLKNCQETGRQFYPPHERRLPVLFP